MQNHLRPLQSSALIFREMSRLGMPGIHFTNGPRGIVIDASTASPVLMARGATCDTTLKRPVEIAIGFEPIVQGPNYFGGVCSNLH